ncbi:hypothetical protein QUF54_10530, partial [Candidatus Marithioploca araucensis]|nr:hypothetical protein [Candidatus Marithioploca araucensis]
MRNNTQSGAALIALLAIFMLSATGILLYRLNNRTYFMLENQAQTARALAQAKEALIGYAASYSDKHSGRYGFLPCPDSEVSSLPEGADQGNDCGIRYESHLGRLPWLTLGIEPLRDGAGECLWYAVSGSYKNASSARTEMLNEDTNGLFEVYGMDGTSLLTGSSPQNRAVAVIIAPGKIIPNQNRKLDEGVDICGGNYTPTN